MAKKKAKQFRASTKNMGAKIWEEVKGPLFIVAGVAGGVVAGKLVDKVVKVDTTATTLKPKALIKPALLLAAGIGGGIYSKNEYLKLIATGVTVSGVLSTTKIILKKDILQGLSEMAGLGATDQVKRVFREPVNITIEPYNPDLPKLPRAQTAGSDNQDIMGPETDAEILGESNDEDISFV
jgi:hypothetical protein